MGLFKRAIGTEMQRVSAHAQGGVELMVRRVDHGTQIRRVFKLTVNSACTIEVEPTEAAGAVRDEIDKVSDRTYLR